MILFVFCVTCANGQGQLWPPQEVPSLEQCRRIERTLGGEAVGPIDITGMTDLELGLWVNADQARQSLSQRLVVKCLPRG